jgi:hypothetical protein
MPGLATAANPTWSITIVKLPATVVSGQDAGYRVTVANAGPSNINGLSLSTNITAPVTYFSQLSPYTTGPGTCAYVNVPFTCNLGTMNAGQSTTFTIAYKTSGTGTFDMTVSLRSSSGDTGSDKGHSRGDALSVTAHTALGSGNFAGGYFQADTLVQTNPILDKKNQQSTSLIGFAASAETPYDVMVRDGSFDLPTDPTDPNYGLVCDNPLCSSRTSEWSLINLKEGALQSQAFHVTLVVAGSLLPAGTMASDVVLVHVWLDSSGVSHTDVIGASGVRCTPSTGTPNNPECITVAKVGANWKVDAWLFHNGGMKL